MRTDSSFLDQVAVLILTMNEAPNLRRTLAALGRFKEIVVLDSGSTDATPEIVRQFDNARLVTRRFDQHAMQWNYGLRGCGIERPWVLCLDADYVVSDALVAEIAALSPTLASNGCRISFRYCVHGRALSGTLYPAHVALFRRDRAEFVQQGHTQRVVVDGLVSDLRATIDHDDRKPLSGWFASQQRYAKLEVDHLLGVPSTALRRVDRVRLTGCLAPPVVFVYTLLVKGCILDGWPGWCYVLQRTVAECMIALELVDRRLRKVNESEV